MIIKDHTKNYSNEFEVSSLPPQDVAQSDGTGVVVLRFTLKVMNLPEKGVVTF